MTAQKGSEILDAAVALGGAHDKAPAKPVRHNDERQQSGLQEVNPPGFAAPTFFHLTRYFLSAA
jgi:hypothetical protein